MQERYDGREILTEDANMREAKAALRKLFNPLAGLKMVALHQPGSVITTEAPTVMRRRDGTEERLPAGRYIVQADGSLKPA